MYWPVVFDSMMFYILVPITLPSAHFSHFSNTMPRWLGHFEVSPWSSNQVEIRALGTRRFHDVRFKTWCWFNRMLRHRCCKIIEKIIALWRQKYLHFLRKQRDVWWWSLLSKALLFSIPYLGVSTRKFTVLQER